MAHWHITFFTSVSEDIHFPVKARVSLCQEAVKLRGALISIVSLSSMEHLDLEIPYHTEWFIAQKEQKLTHLEIFGWFVRL